MTHVLLWNWVWWVFLKSMCNNLVVLAKEFVHYNITWFWWLFCSEFWKFPFELKLYHVYNALVPIYYCVNQIKKFTLKSCPFIEMYYMLRFIFWVLSEMYYMLRLFSECYHQILRKGEKTKITALEITILFLFQIIVQAKISEYWIHRI